MSQGLYDGFGKRTLDAFVAFLLLFVLSPLLALLWVLVRIGLGSPALFQQVRPGRRGDPFCLVKFRTMRDAAGPDGRALPDAERLTPLGRALRATSLDELPELWNVLRGEMSLVGPRPLLVEYLPLYNERQRKRHDVRPGITGWAQVNGRNSLSWEERFEMDVWYVENLSLCLDAKIVYRTLITIVSRTGISAPGQATMTAFSGSATTKDGATE